MKPAILILLSLSFIACEVKVNTGSDDKDAKVLSRNTSKIRNGVEFKTTGGLKVEQAFLTYDDGTLVTEENITEFNRALVLKIVADGWKSQDGQVYLDAEEKVTTNEGDLVMHKENLFSGNNINSVSVEDAKYISLNVVIKNINKLVDHFLVEFRVWNTKHDQEIKGSYKFYINEM